MVDTDNARCESDWESRVPSSFTAVLVLVLVIGSERQRYLADEAATGWPFELGVKSQESDCDERIRPRLRGERVSVDGNERKRADLLVH